MLLPPQASTLEEAAAARPGSRIQRGRFCRPKVLPDDRCNRLRGPRGRSGHLAAAEALPALGDGGLCRLLREDLDRNRQHSSPLLSLDVESLRGGAGWTSSELKHRRSVAQRIQNLDGMHQPNDLAILRRSQYGAGYHRLEDSTETDTESSSPTAKEMGGLLLTSQQHHQQLR